MSSSNQPGPSTQPPFNLPPGWSARWDSETNRYYYVQMANGLTQWEVPTRPAPTASPDAAPPAFVTNAGRSEETEQGRNKLGSLAMNVLSGGKKPLSNSGRGGMGGR